MPNDAQPDRSQVQQKGKPVFDSPTKLADTAASATPTLDQAGCPSLRAGHLLGRCEWGVALALTAILLVFHIVRAMHAGALWRDEISTAVVAEAPSLAAMYRQNFNDSFPLLNAMLVRIWRFTGWGGTDPGLRAYGMLIGLAVLAALWRNAWRFGRVPPLLSLSLLGMSSVMIQWGDSLRAYGLGALFSILTFGWMWDLVRAPRLRTRTVVLATIGAVLCVQTVYQNCFLVLAICLGGALVAILHRRWALLMTIIAAGMLAALSVLFYVPILFPTAGVTGNIQLRPNSTDFQVFEKALTTLRLSGDLVPWIWAIVLVLAAATALFGLVWRDLPANPNADVAAEPLAAQLRRRDLAIYTLVISAAALIQYWAFLHWLRIEHNVWHYIPLLAMLGAGFDATRAIVANPVGVTRMDRQPTGKITVMQLHALAASLTVLCAIVVAVTTFLPVWRQIHERQTNIDQVAALIEKGESKGDVILAIPYYLGPTFRRYYHGPNKVVTLPPQGDVKYQEFIGLDKIMILPHPIDPTIDELAAALRGGHRVWAFQYVPFLPPGQVPPLLPPPPLPDTGWFVGPYTQSWEMQGAYFLQTHGKHLSTLNVPQEQNVNRFEDTRQILIIDGWASHSG